MGKNLVAGLSGENGGRAMAATLALTGFKVNLFELPNLKWFANK